MPVHASTPTHLSIGTPNGSNVSRTDSGALAASAGAGKLTSTIATNPAAMISRMPRRLNVAGVMSKNVLRKASLVK